MRNPSAVVCKLIRNCYIFSMVTLRELPVNSSGVEEGSGSGFRVGQLDDQMRDFSLTSPFPGFVLVPLESSTDPLLSVVWAPTTFHIYPYFPQELPQLHQITSTDLCYSYPRLALGNFCLHPNQSSAAEGLLVMPISHHLNTITCNEARTILRVKVSSLQRLDSNESCVVGPNPAL